MKENYLVVPVILMALNLSLRSIVGYLKLMVEMYCLLQQKRVDTPEIAGNVSPSLETEPSSLI